MPTSDETAIRALIDTWIAASRAGDTATVLSLLTEDVVFLTPGRAPFGRKEFAADAASFEGLKMDGRADIQEIQILGAHAFVRNHLEVTLVWPGQPAKRMSGYTLSVMRKESDGCWRLARDANLVMPVAD